MRNFIDLTEAFVQPKKYIAQGTADVAGDGLWSKKAMTDIKITILPDRIFNADEEGLYGQINAYFNTRIWDTKKYGLIYTDSLFEKHVKRILKETGLKRSYDIKYSEQGMQGHDYVNFDVGEKLASELDKKGLIEVDWS